MVSHIGIKFIDRVIKKSKRDFNSISSSLKGTEVNSCEVYAL